MTSPLQHAGAWINRSMPSSTIIPVLAYAGVREAVDWLCKCFGFVERLRIGDHRSQLSFGDGSVVVAGRQDSLHATTDHSVMVRVKDIDSHYKHAKKSGAEIIIPLTEFPYGEKQYTVRDIGGHVWTFSQTIADVDPKTWGGILFE